MQSGRWRQGRLAMLARVSYLLISALYNMLVFGSRICLFDIGSA